MHPSEVIWVGDNTRNAVVRWVCINGGLRYKRTYQINSGMVRKDHLMNTFIYLWKQLYNPLTPFPIYSINHSLLLGYYNIIIVHLKIILSAKIVHNVSEPYH